MHRCLHIFAVIAAALLTGILGKVAGVLPISRHSVGVIFMPWRGSDRGVSDASANGEQLVLETSDPSAVSSDQRDAADTEPSLEHATSLLPSNAEDGVFSEFNRWMDDYLAAASPEERSALERTGSVLAARRREALENLIQTDPAQSLRSAVPMTVRCRLPVSIAGQLEEPVGGNADLAVIGVLGGADDTALRSTIKRYATLNGRTFRAFVYGRRLQQTTQTDLPIHGIAIGNVLAVHEDPVRPLEVEETPDPAMPVGNADGRCPVSGAAVNPIVAAQVGGQIYHLCCGEHVQAFNQILRTREDTWIIPCLSG